MAKHTPGPWAVNHRESEMPYIVADQGKAWDNPIICNLYEDVTPEDSVTIGPWLEAHPNAQANARLIAAAPQLLQALRDLAAWAGESPEGRGAWEYVNACAAVSAAEGEPYKDIRNTQTKD